MSLKRFVAIGDSSTYGAGASGFFNHPKYIGKAFGFDEVENYGVNGITISPETDWRPTMANCEYILEFLPGDIALITGSANDWIKNVEIGSTSDKTNKTFYGALDILFQRAKERYDLIVVVSSINRLNDGANKLGYTLQDYRDAMKKKTEEYGYYFIEGEKFPVYPKIEESRKKYIPDGAHLNDEGEKLYTLFLIDKIKELTGLPTFDFSFDNSEKKMVAMGDSITHGSGAGWKFGLVENCFAKIVANHYGYELKNYGINGTTIAEQFEWRPTCSLCNYVEETYPADVLIIASGTNDYGRNVEIGNESDVCKSSLYGAMNILFDKARKKYKKIIVITPIDRKDSDKLNEKGYSLQDYRNAIKKTALKYGAFVIDGLNIPIDANNTEHVSDGLHPSVKGQEIYSKYLVEKLKDIL